MSDICSHNTQTMKKYTGLFLLALMLGCSGDDDSTPTPTPPVEEENPVATADELSAVQNNWKIPLMTIHRCEDFHMP